MKTHLNLRHKRPAIYSYRKKSLENESMPPIWFRRKQIVTSFETRGKTVTGEEKVIPPDAKVLCEGGNKFVITSLNTVKMAAAR